jgi:hypothetical protein
MVHLRVLGYGIEIGIELSHEIRTATKKSKKIFFVRVPFSWEKTYLLRVICCRVIGFASLGHSLSLGLVSVCSGWGFCLSIELMLLFSLIALVSIAF